MAWSPRLFDWRLVRGGQGLARGSERSAARCAADGVEDAQRVGERAPGAVLHRVDLWQGGREREEI